MSVAAELTTPPQLSVPDAFVDSFDQAWHAVSARHLPSPADLAGELTPDLLSRALVVDVAREGERLQFRTRLAGTGFAAWLARRGGRTSALPAELERDLAEAVGSAAPVISRHANTDAAQARPDAVYPLSRTGGTVDTVVAFVARHARPGLGARLRNLFGL